MTLQQQVQQHLQNTGISLRELARQAAIGKSTVALVASGRSNPSIMTRRKLQAAIRDYKPQTLDAAIEQLAVQCIDSDLTRVRDTDLECAKYRRVMALEKELNDEKRNFAALEQVHDHVAGNLKSCENALIEAHETITKQEQQLNDANTAYLSSKSQHERDLQRLTALSQTHGQSWKAACVQAEQLQRELKAADSRDIQLFKQKLDLNNEIEFLKEQCVERENAETLHDQQVMRLRMYVWSLIAALVFVLVSSLVVWGGV